MNSNIIPRSLVIQSADVRRDEIMGLKGIHSLAARDEQWTITRSCFLVNFLCIFFWKQPLLKRILAGQS